MNPTSHSWENLSPDLEQIQITHVHCTHENLVNFQIFKIG